jgi:hypothetical protein
MVATVPAQEARQIMVQENISERMVKLWGQEHAD